MVAWTLVFHLIGLVFWLGSLLILTHVLAIHSDESSAETHAALGRLEMKLFKGLAHPGAALMVITGVILVTRNPEYLREFWLRAKLVLVVILILLDLRVYLRTRAFLAGRIELKRSECMAWHGAIALVFFAILILVLVKPFGPRVRKGTARSALSEEIPRSFAEFTLSAMPSSFASPCTIRCGASLRMTANGLRMTSEGMAVPQRQWVKPVGLRARTRHGRDARATAVLVKPFRPRVRRGLLHPPGPGVVSLAKVAVGGEERPFAPTASQQG